MEEVKGSNPFRSTKDFTIGKYSVNSRKMTQAAAVLLLGAAVVVIAFVARTYLRGRNTVERSYTEAVKARDIGDTTRKAVSALQDAESQVQGYVLTGETSYSEGYAEDLRVWQDEFGTLEVEALHDAATPMVKDLSKSGARVLDELAAVVSLRNEGSTASALDRLRKGSAIVYLQHARKVEERLQEVSSFGANEADRRIESTVVPRQRHLIQAAAALFGIALAEGLLVFLSARRGRGAVSAAVKKRDMATVV